MHRLVIHRHGVLLGHFDSDTPAALAAIADLQWRLPVQDGFECTLHEQVSERRILDVSPAGTRVLSSEPVFQSCRPAHAR